MKSLKLVLFVAIGLSTHAQQYSFFHPVPDSLLPEMSTDRPDVTESPESVPAGHFQFESDIIRYERYPADNLTHIHYNYGNYKLGLWNKTDVQLVFPMKTTIFTGGEGRKSFGAPIATVRLKRKLTKGGQRFAIGALPYYTFPIGSALPSRNIGITFPMSYGLNNYFSLNGQVQFEQNLSEMDARLYLGTLNLGYVLNARFQGFVETVFMVGSQASSDFLTDAGIVFCFNRNFRIDAGVNYSPINKWGVLFLGTSIRI